MNRSADESEDSTPAEPAVPTRMLLREQQVGYVLAGVAAAAAVSIAVTGDGSLALGGVGAVGAVLLLLAVRHGHRIMTAAAGFLVGLAFTFFFPLELAFLVFSGYLMMRTSNAQAKLRRAQGPITPAQRRAAAEARAAARSRRRKGEVETTVTVKSPAPNRRYTPPKGKATRRR